MENPDFRGPYKALITSIYTIGNSASLVLIKERWPNEPTDEDVRSFFDNHWPTIRITRLTGAWGESYGDYEVFTIERLLVEAIVFGVVHGTLAPWCHADIVTVITAIVGQGIRRLATKATLCFHSSL